MQVNVGGKIFTSTKDTLSKCAYFSGLLLTLHAEEIPFVDRPSTAFEHVLYYLQDDYYLFPLKFKLELDFYGVPYLKYSQARKTMWSRSLLEERSLRSRLTDLYIEGTAKGFAHLLRRVLDITSLSNVKD